MPKAVIERHVTNAKKLDNEEKLALCGVFEDYSGITGVHIMKTGRSKQAKVLCKS